MKVLLLIQLFSLNEARQAYFDTQYEKAYEIAFSIPEDTLSGFEYYELLEFRGLIAGKLKKYNQAKHIYERVIRCEYKGILYNAYINYADIQYHTFDFDKRIEYLRKAYKIKQSGKVIRNIARHYLQVEANYDSVEYWMSRHPESSENSAGMYLLKAELAEAKRQYRDAYHNYMRAKITADTRNYALFAAVGAYRTQRLHDNEFKNTVKELLFWVILIGIYYLAKQTYDRTNSNSDG